jgi:hypothetical protein
VLQCEETLEAQVSEPRTNSQYHPQHVPGLGEPPKLWATHPVGTLIPVDPLIPGS